MKLTHKFWISTAIVVMAGMFLGFYHAPIKMNDEVRNRIATELKADSALDSILVNTIDISPLLGSLDGKDVQDLTFKTKKDSIEKTYQGWVFTKPKFLGYDIKFIKVNK